MKKQLVFILAGFIILACSTSNFVSPTETPSPTSQPFTVVPIMNEEFITPQSGIGTTPTETGLYIHPTPQIGNALATLDSSVLFFTPSGEAWGVLTSRLEYEVKLDGESFNLPYNTRYALTNNSIDQLAVIPEDITKVWLSGKRLLGCSSPCKGEYVILHAGELQQGLMSLRESNLDKIADSIEFWNLQSALQHACYFSGQSVSKLQCCFRSTESFPTP